MAKYDLHTKLDPGLADAIRRYGQQNGGLSFTAALSVLAARGLAAEGITISPEDQPEQMRAHEAAQ